jgi:hypothetical protein
MAMAKITPPKNTALAITNSRNNAGFITTPKIHLAQPIWPESNNCHL